ncbi:FG-GAP repeat domain-containing protein [Rubrivirga marina]|uniref:VCBS repeat-containing protein n=1 Tax=Rubrivirga marina TaxID=1196024 RepID=A0A271J2Z1_9BACT|nr:VCBS repeat-containing protein [Rubrivirga marina]PAP77079.1 hypothetical protein BSZ37_11900 [Rubrivirga marina]
MTRPLASALAALAALSACDTGGPSDPPPEISFGPAVAVGVDGVPRPGPAVGDVDGDGRADLVVATPQTPSGESLPTLYAALADAGPDALSFRVLPSTASNRDACCWVSAALADLDGDGDPDAVVAGGGSAGAVDLLSNDGSGRFALAESWRVDVLGGADPVGLVAVGDLDGDGRPEVVSARYFGAADAFDTGEVGPARVGSRPATVGPTRVRLRPATEHGEYSVRGLAVADFDGDGRDDVVHGSAAGLTLATFGAGAPLRVASQRVVPALVPSTASLSMAAADLDGDGDTDLVVAPEAPTPRPPEVAALVNDGSGQFTSTVLAVSDDPSAEVNGLAAADFDGDGDVDVVVTGIGVAALLVNTAGRGAPPAYEGRELPGGPFVAPLVVVLAADLDEDGRPDLVGRHGFGSELVVYPNRFGLEG